MSTTMIIVIVVAVIVVVALAALLVQSQRRRHLRDRFGPEYDRTVEDSSSRREAERELSNRERRHQKLDIRPLPEDTRAQYRQRWTVIQQQFVDHPGDAIGEADQMLTEVMSARGYPTDGGHEQQANDLSVEHARTLEHYRTARETLQGHEQSSANTEELRRAMVHYRTVFDDLLDTHEASTARDHSDERKR
jgi:FtsZ-interacting cell division protein ZipA